MRWTFVENTQSTVGSGKRNTQLIIETFDKASGEWDTAAQKCDELEFGGFNDWFLPSIGELDLMYGNLKRRNLGGFKEYRYWSSTIEQPSNLNFLLVQDFTNGSISRSSDGGATKRFVRPIRQVPGPN